MFGDLISVADRADPHVARRAALRQPDRGQPRTLVAERAALKAAGAPRRRVGRDTAGTGRLSVRLWLGGDWDAAGHPNGPFSALTRGVWPMRRSSSITTSASSGWTSSTVSDSRPTTQRARVLRANSSSASTGSVVRTSVTFLCNFTGIRAFEKVIVALADRCVKPLNVHAPRTSERTPRQSILLIPMCDHPVAAGRTRSPAARSDSSRIS